VAAGVGEELVPASVVVAGGAASVVTLASDVEVDAAGSASVPVVAASGGVSTCTVTVSPPSSVTVMVRSCAEAGKTAALKPAVNTPADMSPISSLRRLMKS
jgi:hypothetical protein